MAIYAAYTTTVVHHTMKIHTTFKIVCTHTSGLPVESSEFLLSGVAKLEVCCGWRGLTAWTGITF